MSWLSRPRPLLLAGLGLTHPHDLSGASAGWWTSLHIILVPLFPLLGVSHWVLLHGRPGVIAWIGRVAAFLYIAFYAVTDHIAGIGTGVVMQQSGAASTCERPEIGWLFDVANDVGGAGTWALALAAVATAVVAVRDGGGRVLPGGVLLVVSSGYFAIAGVHIYWPRGVLTMLVMALAFGWVALTVPPSGVGSAADRPEESRPLGRRRITGPVVACTVWLPSTVMQVRSIPSQSHSARWAGRPADRSTATPSAARRCRRRPAAVRWAPTESSAPGCSGC